MQSLRSFKLTITVDPKYHPKIIGRKGAIITNIRTEHDVNIQFPDKNDDNQVQGYTFCCQFFCLCPQILVLYKKHWRKSGEWSWILPHVSSIVLTCTTPPPQDQITITGYEHKATAAKDAIQAIVDELEEMISEDITLDARVHARIIGARGKGIRKIMDEFKVRGGPLSVGQFP